MSKKNWKDQIHVCPPHPLPNQNAATFCVYLKGAKPKGDVAPGYQFTSVYWYRSDISAFDKWNEFSAGLRDAIKALAGVGQ